MEEPYTTGTFRTLPVSGSGSTITGGTSSSSSSTSYEIKTTDINKATIKRCYSIYTCFNY